MLRLKIIHVCERALHSPKNYGVMMNNQKTCDWLDHNISSCPKSCFIRWNYPCFQEVVHHLEVEADKCPSDTGVSEGADLEPTQEPAIIGCSTPNVVSASCKQLLWGSPLFPSAKQIDDLQLYLSHAFECIFFYKNLYILYIHPNFIEICA